MNKVRVAHEEPIVKPEHDQGEHDQGDRLYDVLAAMPFEERIEAIHRMAERMGV